LALLRRAASLVRENSAAALRSLAGSAGTSGLIARQEISAAAVRSLAGFAGVSGLIARQENSAAALRELRPAPPAAG